MATKQKTPAQVAAQKKVDVERAKLAARKQQSSKQKATTVTKTVTKPASKPASKSVTVTASRPKVRTTPEVTVTGKRKPTVQAADEYVYITTKGRNQQAEEVSKANYNMHTGPKLKLKKGDPRLKTINTGYGASSVPGYKKKG